MRNAKRAALGGVLLALAGGCASGPMQPRSGAIAVAPSGTYIDPEIADGYARYKDTLERYGTFYADTVYGVRWCPRDVEPTFAAYQSRGHWAATGLDGKSTGSPYWVSDDSETWGDITMHHGFWVKAEAGRSCWIPGTEETPARVVWRSGNGYVGWAAEPPNWVEDTYDASADLLDWTFVLLGALFQPRVTEQCLCSEESHAAAAFATRPTLGEASRKSARRGPGQAEVAAAERALAAHVAAHPSVDPANTGTATKAVVAPLAPSVASNGKAEGSSSSSSSTKSDSSKSDSSKSDSKSSDSKARVSVVLLPPGDDMFMRLRSYAYDGPVGLAPSGTFLRGAPPPPRGEGDGVVTTSSAGSVSGSGGDAHGSTSTTQGSDSVRSLSSSTRATSGRSSASSSGTSDVARSYGSSGSTTRSSSSGSGRSSTTAPSHSSSSSSTKSSTSSSSTSSSHSRRK